MAATADPDDEALAWAGDEKPATVPEALERAGDGTTPTEKPQIPAALLIAYGILGGVYLIYTLGWVTSIVRLNAVRAQFADPLSEIMFQFGEFLAIASPVIWFAAVFLLSRGRRPIVRLSWLLVGLVVVLPWPFVLGAWA